MNPSPGVSNESSERICSTFRTWVLFVFSYGGTFPSRQDTDTKLLINCSCFDLSHVLIAVMKKKLVALGPYAHYVLTGGNVF